MTFVVLMSTNKGWNTQLVQAKSCKEALDKAMNNVEGKIIPIFVRKLKTKYAIMVAEHNKEKENG